MILQALLLVTNQAEQFIRLFSVVLSSTLQSPLGTGVTVTHFSYENIKCLMFHKSEMDEGKEEMFTFGDPLKQGKKFLLKYMVFQTI